MWMLSRLEAVILEAYPVTEIKTPIFYVKESLTPSGEIISYGPWKVIRGTQGRT